MIKQCLIENCQKPKFSRGLCQSHARRFRLYGDPLAGGTFNGEPMAFYQESIRIDTDECILWKYGKDLDGYGKIRIGKKKKQVHRMACEEFNGPPKEKDLQARHLCGNGHLGCFNPRHLKWGTSKENSEDARKHGTLLQGEKVKNSVLKEDQVLEIFNFPKSDKAVRILMGKYGVSENCVRSIRSGKTWWWLTGKRRS